MPTDIFYGGDTTLLVGVMADPATDPTVWWTVPFISLTVSPQKDRKERPKLGQARNNGLDPVQPIPGFERVGADLVVDADSRVLPRLLRSALGAPTTTGAGPYTHVWASGGETPVYMCFQVKTGASEWRYYRGLVLGSVGVEGGGENRQDYNISLNYRGISRARGAAVLTGTVNAAPADAPISRAVFRADGAAASNTLRASWSWDRQLVEDLYMSSTPVVSGIRPNGGQLSGQAQFRAIAGSFDTMEEGDTIFAPDIQMLGVVSGHTITFLHPKALLAAAPVPIPGPGLIERTFTWQGFQDASNPGAKITVVNDVTSYAAA